MKYICFFFSFILFADSIKNVRYLKPDYSFSKNSEIFFEKGKFSKFVESNSSKVDFYILPSFCDVYATIGNNQIFPIELKLESFLKFGFTHVQLVADKKEIFNNRKSKLPIFNFSEKNYLPSSPNFSDSKYKNYNLISDYTNLEFSDQNLNEFFYINNSAYEINSSLLNYWNIQLKKTNSILRIHTYSDSVSIMDALISGNRILVHPISIKLKNQITVEHLNEIRYTPILNVYRNMRLDNSENSEGLDDLNLFNKNKFFETKLSTTFSEILSNNSYSDLQKIEMKNEYNTFLEFILEKPEILDKIELGSGTGHRLSFAGLSGIKEYLILQKLFPKKKNLLKILTTNSCSRVSKTYRGKIELNEEANFLLLKENPILNPEILFQIQGLFHNGIKIF